MLYSTVPPCLRPAPSLVISVTGEPGPAYLALPFGGRLGGGGPVGFRRELSQLLSPSLTSFTDGVLVNAFS